MESVIAHYCLHKFHILPSEFLSLNKGDKAFIIASILIKTEEEKKAMKKIEK